MSQLPSPSAPDPERLKIAVDAWKHVVSVQMHFNDMEMKIRNLFFTILAAAIGAIGVTQGKWVDVPYLDLRLSFAMLVLAAVAPIAALFYFIDRHWYHRLLQASVRQGAAIEALYQHELPEIQLGQKISTASPLEFKGRWWKCIFFFVSEDNFRKHSRLHSDAKIEILYKSVIYGVLLLAVLDALFKGVQFGQQPLFFWVCEAFRSAKDSICLLVCR